LTIIPFQPLDKMVNATLGGEPGFGNDIAITFYDGYDGVYHHAYPFGYNDVNRPRRLRRALKGPTR